MMNAPYQTPEEATLVTKPTPRKAETEEVDPVLVDWNRADLEPFAVEKETIAQETVAKETVEKKIEMREIVPKAHGEEHGHLIKRLGELRHVLGDAWKAMEETVDEAVKSISSGRDL